MVTIKDKASSYTAPPKIEELASIPVDIEIFDDGEGINPDNQEPYSYSYINLNDKKIRVPDSVIVQLKEHLLMNANIKAFKVKTNGKVGMAKRYTVYPIF